MENEFNRPAGKVILEAGIGILFNLIFLVLLNRYYQVIPFLTEEFETVLPLYNLSIMFAIFFQASRVVILNKVYKVVGEFISMGFFALIAYQLLIVFPFDTSFFGNTELWDSIIRFLIVVPTIIAIVATTINLIKVSVETLFRK